MSKLPTHWDSMNALGAYISEDTTHRLSYAQGELQQIFNLVTNRKISELGVKIRALNIAKVLIGWRNDFTYEEALLDFYEKEHSYNSTLLDSAKYTMSEFRIMDGLMLGDDEDEESLD